MQPRRRRTRTGVAYLELSPGVRFFTADYYATSLGLTRKAFSNLCIALGVPYVYLKGRAYVRYETLLSAFAFISLLGSPDFIGPNFKEGRERKRVTTVRKIKAADVHASADRVAHSIIWGLKLHGLQPKPDFEQKLHTALTDYMRTIQLVGEPLTAPAPEPGPPSTGGGG